MDNLHKEPSEKLTFQWANYLKKYMPLNYAYLDYFITLNQLTEVLESNSKKDQYIRQEHKT